MMLMNKDDEKSSELNAAVVEEGLQKQNRQDNAYNKEKKNKDGAPPSLPPPGITADGVWGTNLYRGYYTRLWSFLCCLLCGLIPFTIINNCCFRFDRRRVYTTTVDNTVYDSTGTLVGMKGGIKVEDYEEGNNNKNNSNSNAASFDKGQMCKGLVIAGMVGAVLLALRVWLVLRYDSDYYELVLQYYTNPLEGHWWR